MANLLVLDFLSRDSAVAIVAREQARKTRLRIEEQGGHVEAHAPRNSGANYPHSAVIGDREGLHTGQIPNAEAPQAMHGYRNSPNCPNPDRIPRAPEAALGRSVLLAELVLVQAVVRGHLELEVVVREMAHPGNPTVLLVRLWVL